MQRIQNYYQRMQQKETFLKSRCLIFVTKLFHVIFSIVWIVNEKKFLGVGLKFHYGRGTESNTPKTTDLGRHANQNVLNPFWYFSLNLHRSKGTLFYFMNYTKKSFLALFLSRGGRWPYDSAGWWDKNNIPVALRYLTDTPGGRIQILLGPMNWW